MAVVVGIYGVGGSGKTTVCEYMRSFYNKEYPGSCCFLQFPSREEDESSGLVKSMKEVLSERGNFTKESLDKINSVQQAMPHLQELLKSYRVFLVLDNVWDWALQRAKQIATMQYIQGSRLLVTARSERLLQTLSSSISIHINEAVGLRLPGMQIVHVPSISEEEAVEALMAYSLTSSQYATYAEDLRGLARSCFFDKQCHPLLLKATGAKLRHLGGHTRNAQDWTQLISRLQQARRIHDDEEIEVTVLNVLKTSFDGLRSKLKNTFLALGTCVPKQRLYYYYITDYDYLSGASEWLSKLSASTIADIRDELVELEYHGLIQISRQIYGEKIAIHDLQMMLIENIVGENNGVPKCFFFEGDVETLSAISEWTRLRYIRGFLKEDTNLIVLGPPKRRLGHMIGCSPFDVIGCFPFDGKATSPNWPNIEVLSLEGNVRDMRHASERLSVKYMQSLRYLELIDLSILEELGGWHGAPNLVSVKLVRCSNLQKIGSMAYLCKLESLVIEHCMSSGQYVTNFSSCENLKRLVIQGNDHLKHLEMMGHLPKLQELNLSGCRNLVDVGMLSSAFPSLQRCNLGGTGILKFPDFNSINLRVLDLSDCGRLQRVSIPDLKQLVKLQSLRLQDCNNLESILDLKQLVKLTNLRLQGCHALKEDVKLGDAALTSLEHLGLQYYSCRFISMSCSSPLPIAAFTNLRWLWADGENKWGSGEISIDVGSSNLPVSLEGLTLENFGIAQEITGLSALVNLKHLDFGRWSSLTRITGLGALTKLEDLSIRECESLREVQGDWEAPFISNLEQVIIQDCPKLETLSTMGRLPSLKRLGISRCPMVQEETLPLGIRQTSEREWIYVSQ